MTSSLTKRWIWSTPGSHGWQFTPIYRLELLIYTASEHGTYSRRIPGFLRYITPSPNLSTFLVSIIFGGANFTMISDNPRTLSGAVVILLGLVSRQHILPTDRCWFWRCGKVFYLSREYSSLQHLLPSSETLPWSHIMGCESSAMGYGLILWEPSGCNRSPSFPVRPNCPYRSRWAVVYRPVGLERYNGSSQTQTDNAKR